MCIRDSYNLLAVSEPTIWHALVIIVSFIAGSSFVMWMGEQVTEFGIGNGISIILFAGILSRVPAMVSSMVSGLKAGTLVWWAAVLVVIGILAVSYTHLDVYKRQRYHLPACGPSRCGHRQGRHPGGGVPPER